MNRYFKYYKEDIYKAFETQRGEMIHHLIYSALKLMDKNVWFSKKRKADTVEIKQESKNRKIEILNINEENLFLVKCSKVIMLEV